MNLSCNRFFEVVGVFLKLGEKTMFGSFETIEMLMRMEHERDESLVNRELLCLKEQHRIKMEFLKKKAILMKRIEEMSKA